MSYEKSVIGSLLLDPHVIETIKGIVNPSDFGNQHLGEALRAIYELSERGDPVDVLSVGDELGNQKYNTNINASDLSDMQDDTPSAANVEYYAEQVRDGAKRRAVQSVARCANEAETGAEAVDEALKALLSINTEQKDSQKDINESLTNVIEHLEAISDGKIIGQSTGLADLDAMIGGLFGGKLYIIGGRPGSGKTVLGLNMITQAIKDGTASQVYSMEMPDKDCTYRMICSLTGLNTRAKFDMQDSDWPLLTAGFTLLKDKPLKIDDAVGYGVSYLKRQIRAHAAIHEKSVYMIDYLQLMKVNGSDRQEGVSEISRELKVLALELDRPIILLVQLNRGLESRPDKRPVSSDIRESGSIEQDADVIIMTYRDEMYFENTDQKGIAELLVRKHRDGESGTVRVKSELQYSRFSDLGFSSY